MPHRITPFEIKPTLPETIQNMAPHLAKCLIRKFCKGLPIFEHTSDNGRILFAGNEQQIATVNKRLDELLIKKLAPRLVAVYCDVLKEEGIYED